MKREKGGDKGVVGGGGFGYNFMRESSLVNRGSYFVKRGAGLGALTVYCGKMAAFRQVISAI